MPGDKQHYNMLARVPNPQLKSQLCDEAASVKHEGCPNKVPGDRQRFKMSSGMSLPVYRSAGQVHTARPASER